MMLNDYINMIKRKYIKKKTSKYLEDIVVYTHKAEVYKVVIRYSELLIKQLKKLGIDYHIIILTDIPKTKIDDELIRNHKKYDNLTIIYNTHTQISKVVSGEDFIVSTNSL